MHARSGWFNAEHWICALRPAPRSVAEESLLEFDFADDRLLGSLSNATRLGVTVYPASRQRAI